MQGLGYCISRHGPAYAPGSPVKRHRRPSDYVEVEDGSPMKGVGQQTFADTEGQPPPPVDRPPPVREHGPKV